MLASSESDVKAGRVAPIEETFDDISKKLNETCKTDTGDL